MKVTALDTHDNYKEGDVYEVEPSVARQLMSKGLVKAGPVPNNKMAQPSENKHNPLKAAGADQPSSSLPVAPAYPAPTVIPLDDGGSTPEQVAAVLGKRPRGRPRKNQSAS